MKKLLYYSLASLICLIIWITFLTLTAGIGIFFMVLFWNGVILPVWKKITSYAKSENPKSDNKETTNENAEPKFETGALY